MTLQELVIDTNIFYTFCGSSSYYENHTKCLTLLINILDCCKNIICQNDAIYEEFKNFDRRMLKEEFKKFFDFWFKEMNKKNKFKWVQLATYIEPDVRDSSDIKFYQTAYNTNSKIFITQESYLLSIKDEIFDELGILTLTVDEANEEVKRFENQN